MRTCLPTIHTRRPGAVLAALAVCLGALGPILAALHAASHESPFAAESLVCDHRPAPADKPDQPSHPRPNKPAPHHECPVCVLLTTALGRAAPAGSSPSGVAPAVEVGAIALTAVDCPARPVRLPSRPRAPPTA